MFDPNLQLYQASDGQWITAGELRQRLIDVGAADCDMLFVQTEIMFGLPNRSLKRKELLGILSDILLSLNVKTILLATFTYSFPNHEAFDVVNSKTSMGALLEYMRKLPQANYRTEDPLLSITILGEGKEKFMDLPHNSLGPGSAFDRLHNEKGVKFLMFGGSFGESFTYVHHVEKMLEVPYRYDQSFTGEIIDAEGRARTETWSIHTACGGVTPRAFCDLEEELVTKGIMKRAAVADGKVTCVPEPEVYQAIADKIAEQPCFFIEKPYTAEDLYHEYQYGKNGERVMHC